MRDWGKTKILSEYDRLQETRKWMKEIPVLHFEKEWNVKIIPPFGGAVIRFWIDYNNKHVSVYFDAYSELGYLFDDNDNPIPYFEMYDGKECHRYYIDESEKMMKDIKEFFGQLSEQPIKNKQWAVVGFDYERAEQLMHLIEQTCEKEILYKKTSRYDLRTEFTDGTILKWIRAAENSRGHRFSKMWCDKKIDSDIFNCVIKPCYMGKREDIIWL